MEGNINIEQPKFGGLPATESEQKPEKPGGKEFKKNENVQEIKMHEIAEMYEPAKRIFSGLRENIETGEYVAILGDDASGRLPALLFHRVLGAIYKEKNFDRPKILFFAGRIIKDPGLEEKIKQDFINFIEKTGVQKLAKDKKVLFVTDTIWSGQTLRLFAEALKKIEINFDIATIGIGSTRPGDIIEREKCLSGGKIFWGKAGLLPYIYGRHYLSGVKKPPGYSLFSKPMPFLKGEKKKKWRIWPETKEAVQKREGIKELNQRRFRAREDVEILAQELIKWYRELK